MLLTKQLIWEAVFAHRFFLARNDLVRKLKALRKRVTSATTCNSQIVKSSFGQAGISIGKWPSARETLRQPLFVGPHLMNPSSPSCDSGTLRKNVVQAFQRHQDRQNPTLGATSTVRTKTDGGNKTMLKISHFSPRGCRARA